MKLKELMKKTKTKRETLSNELQIPKATLDNYIAERRQPDIETIKKLAKYFNVTLDELCDYTIEQSKSENIKLSSDVENKCYNLLVSLTDEQAKTVYAYMMGLTNRKK